MHRYRLMTQIEIISYFHSFNSSFIFDLCNGRDWIQGLYKPDRLLTTELHHQSPVLSETLLPHIASFLREGLSVQFSLTLDLTQGQPGGVTFLSASQVLGPQVRASTPSLPILVNNMLAI